MASLKMNYMILWISYAATVNFGERIPRYQPCDFAHKWCLVHRPTNLRLVLPALPNPLSLARSSRRCNNASLPGWYGFSPLLCGVYSSVESKSSPVPSSLAHMSSREWSPSLLVFSPAAINLSARLPPRSPCLDRKSLFGAPAQINPLLASKLFALKASKLPADPLPCFIPLLRSRVDCTTSIRAQELIHTLITTGSSSRGMRAPLRLWIG
ncbi:hypothetical protein FNV43_RR21219 [Rhamnella rubrinervis]|uniref:Uncharacterized protein n=1 Tax=Rhamnella rubrinervis TaxID=2594499 RepID=A0A8K0E812_9ROSA|nr:hypothetical protein FNV43_RR21219 [Rhamnella rubrinervis]